MKDEKIINPDWICCNCGSQGIGDYMIHKCTDCNNILVKRDEIIKKQAQEEENQRFKDFLTNFKIKNPNAKINKDMKLGIDFMKTQCLNFLEFGCE